MSITILVCCRRKLSYKIATILVPLSGLNPALETIIVREIFEAIHLLAKHAHNYRQVITSKAVAYLIFQKG
jgi:hypothetical protein